MEKIITLVSIAILSFLLIVPFEGSQAFSGNNFGLHTYNSQTMVVGGDCCICVQSSGTCRTRCSMDGGWGTCGCLSQGCECETACCSGTDPCQNTASTLHINSLDDLKKIVEIPDQGFEMTFIDAQNVNQLNSLPNGFLFNIQFKDSWFIPENNVGIIRTDLNQFQLLRIHEKQNGVIYKKCNGEKFIIKQNQLFNSRV